MTQIETSTAIHMASNGNWDAFARVANVKYVTLATFFKQTKAIKAEAANTQYGLRVFCSNAAGQTFSVKLSEKLGVTTLAEVPTALKTPNLVVYYGTKIIDGEPKNWMTLGKLGEFSATETVSIDLSAFAAGA